MSYSFQNDESNKLTHFGILIPLGFLAATIDEYVNQMLYVYSLPPHEKEAIQANARESAERFSDYEFNKKMKQIFLSIPQMKQFLSKQ